MAKVTIIGAGNVGATIANDLMVQNIASDILLVDIKKNKALGEAMDIYQGAPFLSPTYVHAGEYAEAAGSDIVVITSGMPRKPGQTRLDLAQTNVDILKQIIPEICPVCPDAIYILVSNPVDIMTYAFHKLSGIPESHIIGSGTILDTSRLQTILSNKFAISPKSVLAYVYGEHGDASFIPWSLVHIANNPVDEYLLHAPRPEKITWDGDRAAIESYVKTSGAVIIENKGATFYAVSMAVCYIVKCCLREIPTALTVSTLLHGEYGINDICLSTLALINNEGIIGKITDNLTYTELETLHNCADKLKAVRDSLNLEVAKAEEKPKAKKATKAE